MTFIFFSFKYFFYGPEKFYPIQVIAVMIWNLTIVGTLVFSIEGAKATEFLQLLFYAPASYIIYNATKPNFKNFFKKKWFKYIRLLQTQRRGIVKGLTLN